MNIRETMTAHEILTNVRRAGQSLAESADAYLSAMDSEPRPQVKVGEFYLTFDGSLVYVTKQRGACTCPICGGGTDSTQGPLSMFVQLSPVMSDMLQEHQTKVAEQHKETVEQNPEFFVVVLRGGHGIKNLHGEEPGDRYVIGNDGFTLFNKIEDENLDLATKNQLGMGGLSLRRQLKIKILENEEA